jgi:aminoglycoside phosphotransferase (APT) family kinase protein
MTAGTPPADIIIDEALVHGLLAAQHPDLAALPLTAVDAGWDNCTFRLGEALAVRLPRRAAAAELLVNEQEWLGVLAPWLTLPVPASVRRGTPTPHYPWRWSIVRWIDGETADVALPDPPAADALALFLRALHRPAPANAPANAVRGVPLIARASAVEERLARLGKETDAITPGVLEAWRAGLAAAPSTQACWLHGDLHPRNVLVRHGALSAIIDWGDITYGDVATDLASVWMLFDAPRVRAAAFRSYGASPEEISRARAWAVLFGAILLDTGRIDNPRHAAIGALTLRRAAEA